MAPARESAEPAAAEWMRPPHTAAHPAVLRLARPRTAPAGPGRGRVGTAPGCNHRSPRTNRRRLVAASGWRRPLPAAGRGERWDRRRHDPAAVPGPAGLAALAPGCPSI